MIKRGKPFRFCSILLTLAMSVGWFFSAFQNVYAAQVVPNDPLFPKQTYLTEMNVPDAWQFTTGSAQTVVAVLDSGVDMYHPDLRANIWTNVGEIPGDGIDNDNNSYIDDVNGWDFITETPDPTPKFSDDFIVAGVHHGTLISGAIAAAGNNGLGITGISWRSKILPLRVLDSNGEGDVVTVVQAINYAIAKKVDVINLSFVGETDSSYLREAIKRATDANIVVVAASGNDSVHRTGNNTNTKPFYPGCYSLSNPSLISVASLDHDGVKAKFSNFGNCITLSAPGVEFQSTQVVRYDRVGFDTYYGSGWSGTSLSTATVSGVVALMRSIDPQLKSKRAVSILKETCDSIEFINFSYIGQLGCGRVNAARAVAQVVTEAQVKNPSNPLWNTSGTIVVSSGDGKRPFQFFDNNGAKRTDLKTTFLPFSHTRSSFAVYTGIAGQLYLAAPAQGGEPLVRFYDSSFTKVYEFLAFDKRFRGGVSLAVGDVDGDGINEIVVAAGAGGGPHVKIFDSFGNLKGQFFAYHDSFRGGLRVAVGDVNSDGVAEIITTPIKDILGDVRVFTSKGHLVTQFFAYGIGRNARSAEVRIGDLLGDGTNSIITSTVSDGGEVRIFNSIGQFKKSFFPYGTSYRNGISLAVGDLNQDHTAEIVVAPVRNAGPHVRMYNGDGRLLGQFFAYEKKYRTGIQVHVIQ
ncbi:S8 family serine peptidase [Candidatus Uhrbacteria bacterium]|nr:S8 family serine peptidase [Candidatus Uhrbacteria bacterium]